MKARTVCCGKVIDVEKGAVAKKNGEEYLVCDEKCKAKLEASEDMDKMKMDLRREGMEEISRDTSQQDDSTSVEMDDVDKE